MNKVILMGRLTRDPEVRYSAGDNATCIARYTLAVDRRFERVATTTAIMRISSPVLLLGRAENSLKST